MKHHIFNKQIQVIPKLALEPELKYYLDRKYEVKHWHKAVNNTTVRTINHIKCHGYKLGEKKLLVDFGRTFQQLQYCRRKKKVFSISFFLILQKTDELRGCFLQLS